MQAEDDLDRSSAIVTALDLLDLLDEDVGRVQVEDDLIEPILEEIEDEMCDFSV